MAAVGTLLAPRQLGYGIKGGCEAAVHSAKLYLEPQPKPGTPEARFQECFQFHQDVGSCPRSSS